MDLFQDLAESKGFEPLEQLLVQQISNLPRSTTPTTFQHFISQPIRLAYIILNFIFKINNFYDVAN